MATERQTELARKNFENLCMMLDAEAIKYVKSEERFTVQTGIRSKKTDILVSITLNADFSILSVACPVNVTVPENYAGQFAVAVSRINFAIIEGGYDYDPKSGAVLYRISTCYEESVLSEEALRYLLFTALRISDEFHGVLQTVVERAMTPDQIVNFIN